MGAVVRGLLFVVSLFCQLILLFAINIFEFVDIVSFQFATMSLLNVPFSSIQAQLGSFLLVAAIDRFVSISATSETLQHILLLTQLRLTTSEEDIVVFADDVPVVRWRHNN